MLKKKSLCKVVAQGPIFDEIPPGESLDKSRNVSFCPTFKIVGPIFFCILSYCKGKYKSLKRWSKTQNLAPKTPKF